MISPIQKLFQIADDNMNPRKPAHGLFGRRYLLQVILRFSGRVQGWKGIGTDSLSLSQTPGQKLLHSLSGDCRNSFHSHKTGFPPPAFNGNQYRFFPGSTSTTLASGFFTTNISVINFNEVSKTIKYCLDRWRCAFSNDFLVLYGNTE